MSARRRLPGAIAAFAALLLAVAAPALGAGPSAARGKTLFESASLGSNGKRCADCHEAGKRLDDVAESTDAEVAAYANSCITAMLAGKPLAAGSDDLRSLVLHLRSIAPRGR